MEDAGLGSLAGDSREVVAEALHGEELALGWGVHEYEFPDLPDLLLPLKGSLLHDPATEPFGERQ